MVNIIFIPARTKVDQTNVHANEFNICTNMIEMVTEVSQIKLGSHFAAIQLATTNLAWYKRTHQYTRGQSRMVFSLSIIGPSNSYFTIDGIKSLFKYDY